MARGTDLDAWSQKDFWTKPLLERRVFRRYAPEELALKAAEYFEWCNNNPLLELDIRTADGIVCETPVPKVRAFTIRGFLLFVGLTRSNWYDYCGDSEYADICESINDIIHTQKFENAAAGLLNPNLIARDLGIADSVDHKSSDGSMSPKSAITIDATKLSDNTIAELLNATDFNDNEG